jgi:hypothetical protein
LGWAVILVIHLLRATFFAMRPFVHCNRIQGFKN